MLFLEKTPQLSDTDINIYQYIVTHLESVQYMRIRDLAQATFASTASILRFCNKFECNGYSEFRVRLQSYVQSQQEKLKKVDETIFINFLQRTNEALFQKNINDATQLLKEKELVLFVGHGSSNIIAEYGALYFSSLCSVALSVENPANYPINFIYQNISSKICVIVLSVSGETEEIIEYLQHFKRNNSSIICITNSTKSTIAKLSDVCIPYYITEESFEGSNITSQVPALYTVEYLARQVHSAKFSATKSENQEEYEIDTCIGE